MYTIVSYDLRGNTAMYVMNLGLAGVRAEQFSLAPPRITFTRDTFLTPNVFASLPRFFEQHCGAPSPAQLASTATAYHVHLADPLASFLRTPVFLTVGYIGISSPLPLYYHSEADLNDMLEGELPAVAGGNFHTWLSLRSGEIIDFVLGGIGTLSDDEVDIDGIIAGSADELAHCLTYHPTLVGTGFLQRVGAVFETAAAPVASRYRGVVDRVNIDSFQEVN